MPNIYRGGLLLSNLLIVILLTIGVFFLFVSALGLYRLPDLFCRMHAATKSSTLGITGVLLALFLYFGSTGVGMVVLLAIVFQFLTVPVSAHMIARSAYMRGVKLWEGSIIDQLRERYSAYHPFLQDLQETEDE